MTTFGVALLKGLELDYFAANSTACYLSWVDFYYIELLVIQYRYYYGDTVDQVFNTTALISNVSDHLITCTYALYNFQSYVNS